MAYTGLIDFIRHLEENEELIKVKPFVDPVLEISEITDRLSKNNGPAILFENTGTDFPVLINAFGSEKRMSMAIGRDNLDEAAIEIEKAFNKISGPAGGLLNKISALPGLIKMAGILPAKSSGKGRCQQVINRDPDLGIFPVLKCWPYDGGRFVTLPIVHTIHPETGRPNAGMYRMQILDKKTTAMHWQLHKTGANHFEAWRKTGKRMPVSVALGGDPVYAYSATAPLPENIDEYILAGFLRKKKVTLVKCITNELYVPGDADIIIEGYVDPSEQLVWEGPFGDHTGFYSLADWYPKFHVTCITHAKNAVYPATIVGIPPMEDSYLAKATEKIFLSPIKLTLQPEVEDLHMPDPGIAHNLVIVKIKKSYSGQGMKVINSLFGAGQMMFTKYLVVVSGNVDIRNYSELLRHISGNFDFSRDVIFSRGPLDILDHSSDIYAFGGKLGIDATEKTPAEIPQVKNHPVSGIENSVSSLEIMLKKEIIFSYKAVSLDESIPVLILSINRTAGSDITSKLADVLKKSSTGDHFKLILVVDHTVNVNDLFTVAWQILGNSDPLRDHSYIGYDSVMIDGTIKAYQPGGFMRKWPNVVCSDHETIAAIDRKWDSLGTGPFLASPSLTAGGMKRPGRDEIILE
jgi:4-hydroxy-3-polyprenylbenzoate decarboxylase